MKVTSVDFNTHLLSLLGRVIYTNKKMDAQYIHATTLITNMNLEC